jgi:hypothetical protein
MDTMIKLPSGKGYVDLGTAIGLQRVERRNRQTDINITFVENAFMDLYYPCEDDDQQAEMEQDWEALCKHMEAVNADAQGQPDTTPWDVCMDAPEEVPA